LARDQVLLEHSTALGFPAQGTFSPLIAEVYRLFLRTKSDKQLERGVEKMTEQTGKRSGWSWWYLLLLVQFVFMLWVPFYNRAEPSIVGVPFFYWYQLLWVFISAILTAIVYFATNE
jgi:hypothetical protein